MPISLTKNLVARKAKNVAKQILQKVKKDKMPPLRSSGPANPSQSTYYQPDILPQPARTVTGIAYKQPRKVFNVMNVFPDPPTAITPKPDLSLLASAIARDQNCRANRVSAAAHAAELAELQHELEDDLEGLATAHHEKAESLEAEVNQLQLEATQLQLEASQLHARIKELEAHHFALEQQHRDREREQKRKYEELEVECNEQRTMVEWFERDADGLEVELRKARKELERPMKIADWFKQHRDVPMHKLRLLLHTELDTERQRRHRK